MAKFNLFVASQNGLDGTDGTGVMPGVSNLSGLSQGLQGGENIMLQNETGNSQGDEESVSFLLDLLEEIKQGVLSSPTGNTDAARKWNDALSGPNVSDNIKNMILNKPELKNFSNLIENPTILNGAREVNRNPSSILRSRFEKAESILREIMKDVSETTVTASKGKNMNILKKLAEELKKEEEKEEEEEKKEPQTSYEKARKEEEGQRQKGKKSNPFRVLMGIVGKLTDHGWSKQDIVKHVKKHTKFNRETIDECVKIVMDRERKFSQSIDVPEEYGLYSVRTEWKKRSSRELIMRLAYLVDCGKYDKDSDNGENGSFSSLDGEIKLVVSALKQRGYTDEYIDHLKQGIREDAYFPFKTQISTD